MCVTDQNELETVSKYHVLIVISDWNEDDSRVFQKRHFYRPTHFGTVRRAVICTMTLTSVSLTLSSQ